MKKWIVLVLGLAVAAGVQAQTRQTQAEALARYLPYAGAPVDSFRFFDLTSWELVAPDKVVVWPRLNEAYLLTVDQPCSELQWARAIGVTSTAGTVSRRFDAVTVGRERCRINEIRPIDYRRYKQDRDAAKSAPGEVQPSGGT